ncbi:MAG: hypothetical protein HC938_08035, partial [Nitrospira sp.]|nr:hypothetical protein [Nitrospira sp.]
RVVFMVVVALELVPARAVGTWTLAAVRCQDSGSPRATRRAVSEPGIVLLMLWLLVELVLLCAQDNVCMPGSVTALLDTDGN